MWIMAIAKKCADKLRKIGHNMIFRIKLWEMDRLWESMGGNCWGLFPPSFYYTHTEEEIERITKGTLERCQKMIDKL